MRVLYAADKKFRGMLDISLKYTNKHGYRTHIYDLGDLGMGTDWPEKPENSKQLRYFKPRYMLQALFVSPEPVVWMDADAIISNCNRLFGVESIDHVVTWKKGEYIQSYS